MPGSWQRADRCSRWTGGGAARACVDTPRPLDVAVHVADVAALLDAEGVAAAILVGHSFGGVVALEAAARLPGRVRAVVAWEPPYGPLADAPTRAAFAAVAAATERAHATGGGTAAAATFLAGVAGDGAWAALSTRARAFIAAQGDGAYADAALAGLDPDGLARITVPVTILTGGASEPFYAPIARALVERIPGARLVALRRAPPPRPDHGPRARRRGHPGRRRRRPGPRQLDGVRSGFRAPGGQPMSRRRDDAPSGLATERGNAAPSSEVRSMFDGISGVYDAMNLVISAFQEPRWRRRAVALARLRARRPGDRRRHGHGQGGGGPAHGVSSRAARSWGST